MQKSTINLWLLSLSPSNIGGGVPLSLPLVDAAATVMVYPVLPVAAATCTGAAPPAPCPDPPCVAMLAGMYARVFGPEDATITGAFDMSGCWVGSTDAAGAVSTAMVMPWEAASSIWGRMGSCGVNGVTPWSVAMWWRPPASVSSWLVLGACSG